MVGSLAEERSDMENAENNSFEDAQEHLQLARKAVRAAEAMGPWDFEHLVQIANLHLSVVTATAQLIAASAALLTASTSAQMGESMRQTSLSQKEGLTAMVDIMDRQLRGESGLEGL
jgi:hypothetical protein